MRFFDVERRQYRDDDIVERNSEKDHSNPSKDSSASFRTASNSPYVRDDSMCIR